MEHVHQGQILVLSQGEYSDYGIVDIVRVLVDFDIWEALQEAPYHRDARFNYEYFYADDFVSALIKKGLVEKVPTTEYWLSTNGEKTQDLNELKR